MSYYHPPLEGVDVTMMAALPSDVRYVSRTDKLAATEMRLVSLEAYDALRAEVERLRSELEVYQFGEEVASAKLAGEVERLRAALAKAVAGEICEACLERTAPSPGESHGS